MLGFKGLRELFPIWIDVMEGALFQNVWTELPICFKLTFFDKNIQIYQIQYETVLLSKKEAIPMFNVNKRWTRFRKNFSQFCGPAFCSKTMVRKVGG